ncbi:hypothetical protein MGYG_02464 [Nannizzia gypsea CBS 118893]|uniref:Carbohydrate-binding module family 96 domain-containing protein n=1 Tax=Arthroderma gypseum (strain ATCC MYA-4604 / CBS 118893) TaxID=535722 RepID=E4UMN6_ARTGP|nr:hypothetical protein MGYG_02464 [Nannizzia gypsea CBS 118893]EFQ99453.1 hypothetical protein MGYG_02464 [Nannizzia gypsea CBS 118893]
MHFSSCLLVSALALVANVAIASPPPLQQVSRPALKDSTIYRSTVYCGECPEGNCYKCTLGHNNTLIANTGGMAYLRALVGFQLPVPAKKVEKCTVQFPAFVKLMESPINITVSEALSNDWDEDTVTGENAPETSEPFSTAHVPALNNPPALDATQACRNAARNGDFSIYVGAQFGRFEIWSKDSGNPAILHIYHK